MAKDRSRCDSVGQEGDDRRPQQRQEGRRLEVLRHRRGRTAPTCEVLTCKEVDLNFDGKKDMWVYYDNAGNINNEEYDSRLRHQDRPLGSTGSRGTS